MKIFFTYAWQFIAYAVSYVAITWAMNALFRTPACPPALSERLLTRCVFRHIHDCNKHGRILLSQIQGQEKTADQSRIRRDSRQEKTNI